MALANDFNEIKALKSRDEVKTLQTYLSNKGYDIGAKGVDGWYGKKTKAALMKFQQDNGLKVDGIVGDQTIKAMNGNPPSTASTPATTSTSTSTTKPAVQPKTTTTPKKEVVTSNTTSIPNPKTTTATSTPGTTVSNPKIKVKETAPSLPNVTASDVIDMSQKYNVVKKEAERLQQVYASVANNKNPKISQTAFDNYNNKLKELTALEDQIKEGNKSLPPMSQGNKDKFFKTNSGVSNGDVFTNKNTRNNIKENAKSITEGNKINTILEKGGVSSSYNPKSGGTDHWTYRKVKLNNGKILFQKVNSLGTTKNINEGEYNNSKGKKR